MKRNSQAVGAASLQEVSAGCGCVGGQDAGICRLNHGFPRCKKTRDSVNEREGAEKLCRLAAASRTDKKAQLHKGHALAAPSFQVILKLNSCPEK